MWVIEANADRHAWRGEEAGSDHLTDRHGPFHPSLQRPQLAKSEFLGLHLSAPSSSKICSLYLFDAIARHARDIIKKNGAGIDYASSLPSVAHSSDPKAAFVSAAREFLSQIATIVEEVAVNTASTVKTEQKVSTVRHA